MDALRRRQRCDRTAPMTRKLTACRRVRLVPRLLSWGLGRCAIALPAYAAPDAGGNTYTRAVVRSLPSPAEPQTVRLKLLPRGKLPFTTLGFRIGRPDLLDGLRVGDEVGFRAERRQGANTLTHIRKLAPCVRFQPCPLITGD